MRLNDALITSFIYKNKEYEIDLSFDNVLDVFDALEDKSLFDHEKASINIELLTGEKVYAAEAVELWNYIYTEFIELKQEKRVEFDLKGNPMPIADDGNGTNLVDFEKDAPYIYTSFRQAYGINLYAEHGKMHWFEFRALFHGLPDNTIMKWIMQIRAWKPSKGESDEHKQRMRELQKRHALSEEVE